MQRGPAKVDRGAYDEKLLAVIERDSGSRVSVTTTPEPSLERAPSRLSRTSSARSPLSRTSSARKPLRSASWRAPMDKNLSREDAIVRHASVLGARLARLGLREREAKADGNCQFRALSFELFGTSEHFGHVRETVARLMQRKRDEFEPYVEGPWDDYVAALTDASSWGDELTLQASAEAWDVVVHVVTSSDEHYYLMYGTPAPSPRALFTPRAARRKRTAQRHCFLTYTAPVHYNVLSAEPVPPGGDELL